MVNVKVPSEHFAIVLYPNDKSLKYSRRLVESGAELKGGQHYAEFHLTHVYVP